jgi:O-antigen/teichoic acid export membrane protein
LSSVIKRLAGQTAIYGLSNIVGRLLNYFLVPLHTHLFTQAQFGTITEFYAYSSFLFILFTYGMETAYFRFATNRENKSEVFDTSIVSLIVSSISLAGILFIFSQPISDYLGYSNQSYYIKCFAIIMACDALSAIPFARLRLENRPLKYASLKLLNIGLTIGLNILFLLVLPKSEWLYSVFSFNYLEGYVFLANVIASVFTFLIFLPAIVKIKYQFNSSLFKEQLVYAMPLIVVGLGGMINETLDRVMLKKLLPFSDEQNLALTGIYGACYKLSILMALFRQAYQMAAEPFFFNEAKKQDAKTVYASTMNYFVAVCAFIFLAIMINIDWLKYFIDKKFHEGLFIVPILLIANLCLGVYYNLSIWFKLSDRTAMGAYITLIGAVITLAINFYFIPTYGYAASAYATLICYVSMMLLSYTIGQYYYPVNYSVKKFFFFLTSAIIFWCLQDEFARSFFETNIYFYFLINIIIMGLFLAMVYWIEFKRKKLSVTL